MTSQKVILERIDNRLARLREAAAQVKAGLRGEPFIWDGFQSDMYVPYAAQLGVTLVTLTQIKQRGYRLKRGAAPVGSRSFGAPIQQWAALYVLECQAVKKAQDAERAAG